MNEPIKAEVFNEMIGSQLTNRVVLKLLEYLSQTNPDMTMVAVFSECQALGEALQKLPHDKLKELFRPIIADALSDLLNAKVEITW